MPRDGHPQRTRLAAPVCRVRPDHPRWQTYPEIIGYYRTWLGQLPAEAAARIAWKNGAALFGLP